MTPSNLRDNHQRGTVGAFLQQTIKPQASLSFVTAYFTIYAFGELQKPLSEIKQLRLLFGEPQFVKSLDSSKTTYQAFALSQDRGLKQLADHLQQSRVAAECAEWIREKVKIKSIRRQNFLHGKMYHVDNNGIVSAILGSSNFTVAGLGLGKSNNVELNLIASDDRDKEDLKAWFDNLWEDNTLVEDVTEKVLEYLEQLYSPNAPEFIYFKTLYHLFGQNLEAQQRSAEQLERSTLHQTKLWAQLYQFQQDGVTAILAKLSRYNGCIVADSVGLGKTFEALAVIRHFELQRRRVLVLCPKKLSQNWLRYIRRHQNPLHEENFKYTLLAHTDLNRISGKSESGEDLATFEWGSYDLVVIDESHHFRNQTSRYELLMKNVLNKVSGEKTKVLLLSATPVNNHLRDLRNQLYLFTEGQDNGFADTLGITNLKETFGIAQKRFNDWMQSPTGQKSQLIQTLGSSLFRLLDELTIARSRRHVESFYQNDMEKLGSFPQRLPPLAITAAIDVQGQFCAYHELDKRISDYQLVVFNPSKYIREECRQLERYRRLFETGHFQQLDRENHLIGMMKMNFLKRLESSIHAFAITMHHTLTKIEALMQNIRAFQTKPEESLFDSVKPEEWQIDSDEDEELEEWSVGEKLRFYFEDLSLADWLQDLEQDRVKIAALLREAQAITPPRDDKLQRLKALIQQKVAHPSTNRLGQPVRKVLVFTAFADTAKYLYQQLHEWAKQTGGMESALVTGNEVRTTLEKAKGKANFETVLTHFSPRSKEWKKGGKEIDLLIATDCISEGQNLQDADYLINYDIHWNPVRVIQRFGRIDRLNSVNATVQMVNFWPTDDLEEYLNLNRRVKSKMALVDVTGTGDDDLLSPELISDEFRFRDKQLQKLKNGELPELENTEEGLNLTDFSLENFRLELAHFLASKARELGEAPLGLYAVVPPAVDQEGLPISVKEGIIFCLEWQPTADRDSELLKQYQAINRLHPFFLVYVQTTGEVRVNFTQPKLILEIFQALCLGQTQANEALWHLFNKRLPANSTDRALDRLAQTAVDTIVKHFQKDTLKNVFLNRVGKIPAAAVQLNSNSEFRLITWLVIQRK
jgi:SNF2 family DNA or RNA helicase